ncbi:DNA polymerase III subunit delta' [Candidatus Liberibacter sp.]|uniref:DNA polymerase III subunit delta' n=1 Tax=Candidatus Liberibacter sp. TaxID=34022 RepID=UPI0015F3FCF0|nr:DNA polymerase III subunit delta' [Candidatus Liberibacter sp.]MBA5724526.1 DNA polymerase III subunit delta' [Candidatus Liberibacter sp.]
MTFIPEDSIHPIYNKRLFGQEAVEKFLAHYYLSGKMHHALLFKGEEGIGKATLGFRYARHIFQNPDSRFAPSQLCDPDPKSAFVKQMASQTLRDFLYLSYPLDEKSGKLRTVITVDEIRRIRYFLSLTANIGHWRIVMIDPADGMNRNAANALLKILEEPPARVLFILISHVSGRVLSTVQSRCLPIKFQALSEKNLYNALENLGILFSRQQGEILQRASHGSVATALKILNHGGDKIISSYTELMCTHQRSFARQIIQQIADELSHKDKNIAFYFLIEFVLEDVAKSAKEAALNGKLGEADQIALIFSSIKERLDTSFTYNLDRKYTIVYILEKAKICYSLFCRDSYAT